jgi:hypothetical protein
MVAGLILGALAVLFIQLMFDGLSPGATSGVYGWLWKLFLSFFSRRVKVQARVEPENGLRPLLFPTVDRTDALQSKSDRLTTSGGIQVSTKTRSSARSAVKKIKGGKG